MVCPHVTISYLDCPHYDTKPFTSQCTSCGYSIYMTNEEYLRILVLKIQFDADELIDIIRIVETRLGIKRIFGFPT